jgi:hypothetical protein
MHKRCEEMQKLATRPCKSEVGTWDGVVDCSHSQQLALRAQAHCHRGLIQLHIPPLRAGREAVRLRTSGDRSGGARRYMDKAWLVLPCAHNYTGD